MEDWWEKRNRKTAALLMGALLIAGAAGMAYRSGGYLKEPVFFLSDGDVTILCEEGAPGQPEWMSARVQLAYADNAPASRSGAGGLKLPSVYFPELGIFGEIEWSGSLEAGAYSVNWLDLRLELEPEMLEGGKAQITEAEISFPGGETRRAALGRIGLNTLEGYGREADGEVSRGYGSSSSSGQDRSGLEIEEDCRLAGVTLLGGERTGTDFTVTVNGMPWSYAAGADYRKGSVLWVESQLKEPCPFVLSPGILILEFEDSGGERFWEAQAVGDTAYYNAFSCGEAELRAYLKERGAV